MPDQTVRMGKFKSLSDQIKATDINGHSITHYRVKDGTGEDNFYLDGKKLGANNSAGYEIPASMINKLALRGDNSGFETSQELFIKARDAYDGYPLSGICLN